MLANGCFPRYHVNSRTWCAQDHGKFLQFVTFEATLGGVARFTSCFKVKYSSCIDTGCQQHAPALRSVPSHNYCLNLVNCAKMCGSATRLIYSHLSSRWEGSLLTGSEQGRNSRDGAFKFSYLAGKRLDTYGYSRTYPTGRAEIDSFLRNRNY